MSDRTAHLIVGVPRSGTSAVAQFLSDGGIHFGDPAHFLDTTVHKHNPNFFEMEWVNELNNLTVEAMGSLYSDDFLPTETDFDDPALDGLKTRIVDRVQAEFGDAPHIGIKDPRFCFTFPLWRRLLEQMGYAVSAVVTLRSEAACRRSNAALEPKWTDDRLWTRFYLQSLLGARYFTRDVPTVVIDYDRLMADPAGYVVGLDLPGVDLAAATAKLDPALVHQRAGAGDGDALVDRIQRALRDGTLPASAYLEYRTVATLQAPDISPATARANRAELEAAREQIAELTRQREAVQLHADQLTEVVAVKQAAVDHHERNATELDRLRAATQLHAEQLTAAVDAKQAAVDYHEQRATELERLRAALELHAQQLTDAVAAKQSAVEHHERRADDLEQQRAGLQLHADQLTAVVAAKQAAVDHHEARATALEAERAGLQQHADQLAAVVADRDAAAAHQMAQLAEMQAKLAAADAEANVLRAQRATLRLAAAAPRRWSFRKPAPLTEAQLESAGPTRSIIGAPQLSGPARVEVTLSSPVPTTAFVYWDAGGPYNPARRVELGKVHGPTDLSVNLQLTEPTYGFWLEPADGGGPLQISRLRIFCVGR